MVIYYKVWILFFQEQFLSDDFEYDDVYFNLKDEDTENFLEITPFKGMRGKKKIHKNPELMTARRKKVFAMLSKRELGKVTLLFCWGICISILK